MDTNGSTESFELVTEDNNGEGKAKLDGKSIFHDQHLKLDSEQEKRRRCDSSVVTLHFFSSIF